MRLPDRIEFDGPKVLLWMSAGFSIGVIMYGNAIWIHWLLLAALLVAGVCVWDDPKSAKEQSDG